ncbi:hypothetical protein BH09VER1_BH09VER1_51770 [soil metagenome]
MKRQSSQDESRLGFSLVEMLVVMAIIAILMVMTLPAFSSLTSGWRLTQAAAAVRGELQMARQLSIGRNLNVIVNLCQRRDDAGSTSYNTILLQYQKHDGTIEAATRAIKLPPGFAIAESTQWSSLMSQSLTNATNAGTVYPCRRFSFRPGGALSLNSSSNWFVTVYRTVEGADPSKNYIILQIDPLTGVITTFQP